MSNLIIVLIAIAPIALTFAVIAFWRPTPVAVATDSDLNATGIPPYAIPNILATDPVQRELELAIDEMF